MTVIACLTLWGALAGLPGGTSAEARQLTINVVDGSVIPPAAVSGFRWLIEEDTTHSVVPGEPVSDSIGLNIHNSYAPVVQTGESAGATVSVDLPDGRYAVSVLPTSTTDAPRFTLSGTNVEVGPPPLATSVTISVYPQPIPTAQITVFVFNDNRWLNNAPDIPEEEGLAGFTVAVFDIFGQTMFDAMGNPLGTTYRQQGGEWVVDMMGSGIILTDMNGEATISNLPAGKFGIRVIPPAGTAWIQTNTIEGTPGIDAWVEPGEAPLMLEGWGPGFYHAYFGFVLPGDWLDEIANPSGSTATITGQFINNHLSHPPQILSYPGAPVEEAWVGLSLMSTRQTHYVAPCDAEGSFSIAGVPPGTYQLSCFDTPLDWIFGFTTVTVPETGGLIALGEIPQFAWFGSIEGKVFYDADGDGFPDEGEPGMPEQAVNLRYRDGSMYQATITDITGEYGFQEIFPFFKWLVIEVDFLRYKATGATFVVDHGGVVLPHDGWDWPSYGKLTPQPQAEININTGNNLSRTETGPVLTQGFILQAGEPNVAHWGKQAYAPGENGGISGIVRYATTRAENDPRYGAPEDWEPGIPRVQVNLYLDADNDQIIDDYNSSGGVDLADVDNYPFGNFPGPEDVDRHPGNAAFDLGDALDYVTTDSWDDNKPEGCIEEPLILHGELVRECIDNFRTWDQIRPAVFDGGYAFSELPEAPGEPIPPGIYIVEAVLPPGYELVKEEDKNVDFGDGYEPALTALPPVCVGDPALFPPVSPTVPEFLSLFPDVPCARAGQPRMLCNMKQVLLRDADNAACDFYFFTMVPKAARAVGFITNDIAATFGPLDPMQGEKPGPSWLPISFQDWTGREVVRTYCDEFGTYNALLPSTFTANVPAPSGMSPNMLTIMLNHPGPIPDPDNPGQWITDPHYDPAYSQAGWTMDFWPAKTTYIDSPLLAVGSFRDTVRSVDCAFADGTPVIRTVSGPGQGGPYVTGAGARVTITAMGHVAVPNPDYDPSAPVNTVPPTIRRDFTFGPYLPGSSVVTVGGIPLTNVQWASDGRTISGTVPSDMQTGEVVVTRGDNRRSSVVGVTLHVGSSGGAVIRVNPGQPNAIQHALDAANPGDLILVAPGIYREAIIISEQVRLQGWGAGVTVIDGSLMMDQHLVAPWKQRVQDLLASGAADLVPGQIAADPFATVPGPTVLVFTADGAFTPDNHALIDGFTIMGAPVGGGVLVNGYADYLEISNNVVVGNFGDNGGGIIVGTPSLQADGCPDFCGSGNDFIYIHNNQIKQNTGLFGGGGIALFNGTSEYVVENNDICGNMTLWYGGGIAHYGYSANGVIASNRVLFNEVYWGGPTGGDGGGIFVGGETDPAGGLTPGSGSVAIVGNLIQGNGSGSGWGGGIRLLNVNGRDVAAAPDTPAAWHEVRIFNNMIVNNLAAFAGGAIALEDSARVKIIHDSIANNDSTATSINAYAGGFNISVPQPAGIVSVTHSPQLLAALGQGTGPEFSDFSDPVLINCIVWASHSYQYNPALNAGWGGLEPNPAQPLWDFEVISTTGPRSFSPMYCALTDPAGYDPSNIAGEPGIFTKEYANVYVTAAAGPEGGNAVIVAPIPLTATTSEYHLEPGTSPAIDQGTGTVVPQYEELQQDYDHEPRTPAGVDLGADELAAGAVDPYFIGVYRNGLWYLDYNGNGVWNAGQDRRYAFGNKSTRPVTGDWNLNGKTEIGVYTAGGFWLLDHDGNGIWNPFYDRRYLFLPFMSAAEARAAGLDPIRQAEEAAVADFVSDLEWTVSHLDNDQLVLDEASPVVAYLAQLLPALDTAEGDLSQLDTAAFATGLNLLDRVDLPVTGDWNGDGRTEIGIYRNGTWFLDANGDGRYNGPAVDIRYDGFGQTGDKPVTGDWNSDGQTEIGVYRGGAWLLDVNGNGVYEVDVDLYYRLGGAVDEPVTGDWAGYGSSAIGVRRNMPVLSRWYLDYNGNGAYDGAVSDRLYTFGNTGDLPVSGKW